MSVEQLLLLGQLISLIICALCFIHMAIIITISKIQDYYFEKKRQKVWLEHYEKDTKQRNTI